MINRDSLAQNILNLGCALNGAKKRCRFDGCFHPEVPGTGACHEHLEEITPPEHNPLDSEDMSVCDLREEEH